jgi:hypothetical protein
MCVLQLQYAEKSKCKNLLVGRFLARHVKYKTKKNPMTSCPLFFLILSDYSYKYTILTV